MRIDWDYRSFNPVPRPNPLRTFPRRFLNRNLEISYKLFSPSFRKMRLIGAQVVGMRDNGNILLKLNKSYALGEKGFILEVPKDKSIYSSLLKYGSWELQESHFISECLSKSSGSKSALVDIGANIGLVTLQAMNISKSTSDVFLIEPIPDHVTALKFNLRELMRVSQINIHNFALAEKDGFSDIYIQKFNRGNTSFYSTVMPQDEIMQSSIETCSTASFFDQNMKNFEKLIIKCDIQGLDAKILSLIPFNVWEKISYMVVEVWALPEIQRIDVNKLMNHLKSFNSVVWSDDPYKQVSLQEVSTFWLSKNNQHKNLYLSRFD